ncbi:tetraspanin-18-like [Protopterus annectens]|uniref:tetraspanin-18-like n=1 Tax=Protopterus annectens TaxID=7888 RepID=UPI001CFBAF0A|nr:tetraspanin-18-like [Protopterus annectens]
MGLLSCMKYMMFAVNALIFAGGVCLLAVGIWVVTDPDGFQNIITSSPLLYTGAYIILVVGLALSLLGFLGCWGAVMKNKPVLMIFFLLVLILFILELVAAILALAFGKQVKHELFLSDLQKRYLGDNTTDMFSKTWNTVMIVFTCCGVLGPGDFGNHSTFHEQHPYALVPDACCKRDTSIAVDKILDRDQCMQGKTDYLNYKGCFEAIAKTLQRNIKLTGAFSLGILVVEMFAMFFSICLFHNFD